MQIALEEQTRKTSPWVHRVWDLQEACGDRDPDAQAQEALPHRSLSLGSFLREQQAATSH